MLHSPSLVVVIGLILHPFPVFLPGADFLSCHHHEQYQQGGNAESKHTLRAESVKGAEGLLYVRLPCPIAAGGLGVSAPGGIILSADIVH
jgi:hypothetical protein